MTKSLTISGRNIVGYATDPEIIIGLNVTKYGAKTGVTSGKITYLNKYIARFGGVNGYVTETNLAVEQGDSGGSVILTSPIAQGSYILAGIVSSGTFSNTNMGFISYKKIEAGLGLAWCFEHPE